MNNTTFPPPYGTWYSRWAHLYHEVPEPAQTPTEPVALPTLPRLSTAA